MPELLSDNNKNGVSSEAAAEPSSSLAVTEAAMAAVLTRQQQMLAGLQPVITRKAYFQIEEKLKQQEQAFKKIAGLKQQAQEFYSQYTYVLDPTYFEQLIMGE